MAKKDLFAYAFKKSIPVMLGYIFLGIAYGIVLEDSGFGWPWALLTSAVVYAGSMQFALVPLMTALTPLPTVALMTLMVNSRHLFYGLSFVDEYKEMGKKYPYMVFSLTDETYSVLCSCKGDELAQTDHHDAYFYISLLDQIYWTLGSVIGAIAGARITFDTTGIDFAMIALFVVILVDQIRSSQDAWRYALLGIVVAVIFLLLLGADDFLLPTLFVTVAGILILNRIPSKTEGGDAA